MSIVVLSLVTFAIHAVVCPFDYKHSFKAPLINHKGKVPFFVSLGNSIPNLNNIRLVPSIVNQKGIIYSKNPITYKWWEVIAEIKITGSTRIGADGMALWYIKSEPSLGPVFGGPDQWSGLCVALDSYDNDAKHDNPIILAMINNGTYSYHHDQDGADQHIGSCRVDFRNSPFPSQLRVQYYQDTLTVWYLHGHSERKSSSVLSTPLIHGEANFAGAGVMCFRAKNVYLPTGGRFALSAMTGGFGDDHDVFSFLTFEISESSQDQKPLTEAVVDGKSPEKHQKEYNEMLDIFEKEQQQFIEKGGVVPDQAHSGYKKEDLAEDGYSKNLHAIFTTHSLFAQQLELIGKMLLDMNVRHETTLQQAQTPNNFSSALQPISQQLGETLIILRKSSELLRHVSQEIKELLGLRESVEKMRSVVQSLAAQSVDHSNKNSCSHCVGTLTLIAVASLQFLLYIFYNAYTSYQNNRNKKYF